MTYLACVAFGFGIGALAGLRIAESILAGISQRIAELEREAKRMESEE